MERKFILNSKLSPKHRSKHSACPGHLDAITKAIGIGKYLIGAGWRKGGSSARGLLEREGRGGAGRKRVVVDLISVRYVLEACEPCNAV